METRIFGNGAEEVFSPNQVFGTLGPEEPQTKLRGRRSPLEIRMDILKAVRDGALGPTQIMYKANLSWIILMGHLKDLVERGILSEHKIGARLTYVLTERGINILGSYLQVLDQLEQFELDRGTSPPGQQSPNLFTR